MLALCGEDPAYVMSRGVRLKRFLRGLVKLAAIVVIAGGVGVALGMGLSRVAQDDTPTAPVAQSGSDNPLRTSSGPTGAAVAPTTTSSTAPAAPTTTTPPPDESGLGQVRVSVLDARLFTDGTPSGRQDQRSSVTVRLRAENAGGRSLTLPRPVLRVGSVRVPADAAAGADVRGEPLPARAQRTVTLRFSLSGEATPKLVRDRRARLQIAGRSVAMRVKVRAPTT